MFIISNEPTNGGINITNIMGFYCSKIDNRITFCRYDYERYSDYSWNYPDQKAMLSDYAKIVNEIKLYQQTHSILARQILVEGDNDQNTGG